MPNQKPTWLQRSCLRFPELPSPEHDAIRYARCVRPPEQGPSGGSFRDEELDHGPPADAFDEGFHFERLDDARKDVGAATGLRQHPSRPQAAFERGGDHPGDGLLRNRGAPRQGPQERRLHASPVLERSDGEIRSLPRRGRSDWRAVTNRHHMRARCAQHN